MAYQAGLSQIAALLADPAREAMLAALIGDHALSAGELAAVAALSPQNASAHLRRLLEGGILSVATEGRQRRYRIANARIAATIESLASLAGDLAADRARHAPPEVRFGRQCYDHLAGALGVALARALEAKGYLRSTEGGLALTPAGEAWFAQACPGEAGRSAGQGHLRLCLDWTEGEPHLAGPLAGRLLRALIAQGHVVRRGRERVVSLTPTGRAWFAELDIRLEPATATSTRLASSTVRGGVPA